MNSFHFEKKYLKMVDSLVYKYPKYLQDDLKQELLMKLYKLLIMKRKIYETDSYIYISLKNCAIDFYRKERSNMHLSLNQTIQGEYEMIDFIIDDSSINHTNLLNLEELNKITNEVLTNQEKQIFEEYFYYNIKQKDLAKKYYMTQQNISKIIKKSLSKIKKHTK